MSRKKARTEPAVVGSEKASLSISQTVDWPFGRNARALEGFLLSLDPTNDDLIQDHGHGIRSYPDRHRDHGRIVIDSVERTCTNLGCKEILGDCKHLWHDDFRYGQYRNIRFVPPPREVTIREKSGEAYSSVVRNHPRPNPTVDGEKAATIARHAREDSPRDAKAYGRDLAEYMRRENHDPFEHRHRGRPPADIYDIALVGALRILNKLTYEELKSAMPEWVEQGYLLEAFHYNRLVEAMHSAYFTEVLDRMCLHIERYFRLCASVFVTDGFVLSTKLTDNPRTQRYARGGARVLITAQYEIRWGLLTGFRLTWNGRGRGSGEAPQYPYITTMTRRIFNPQLDLADAAFATDRNFAWADEHNLRLVAPLDPATFKPDTKKFLTPERAAFHLTECNVRNPGLLFRQTYPFRNRGEGWHNVVRRKSERYLLSRPDLSRMPLTRAEDTKKHPDLAYIGLPFDQAERDAVIEREQFVGWSPLNEIHCRRLALHLRALSHAAHWYKENVNFFINRPFTPRPEDDAFSVFRPLETAA